MTNLIPLGVNTTTGALQALTNTDTLVDTSSRNVIGSNIGTLFIPIDNFYQYAARAFPSITVDGNLARYRAFDITTDPAFAVTFIAPADYSNTTSTFGLPGAISAKLICSPSSASGGNVFFTNTYNVYQVTANTVNSSGASGAQSITATTGPVSIGMHAIYASIVTGGINPGDLISVAYTMDSGVSTYLGQLRGRGLEIRYPIRA